MSIRPPRVRMITFHSCHCLIYCRRFVQYGTLLCFASSSVSIQPYMRFLFVSASICVRLPSDSTSRWTPLSFANSSYCKACSGLSPPSYHPCRAHSKTKRGPGSKIQCPLFKHVGIYKFFSTQKCITVGVSQDCNMFHASKMMSSFTG